MPGLRVVQIKRDIFKLLTDSVYNIKLTSLIRSVLAGTLVTNRAAVLTQLSGKGFLCVKCELNVVLATLVHSRKAKNLPSKFAKQQETG